MTTPEGSGGDHRSGDGAWDAEHYDDAHSFVHEEAADLVDLLDPRPGERVLDLGCGTGHLTAAVAGRGADAVGVDASAAMIERAREAHPDVAFRTRDATALSPERPVDAVFSNAALHWIDDQDAVLERVRAALAAGPGDESGDGGGRFVAEMGGHGNISGILRAALAERHERGHPVEHPWYFPTVGEYAGRLEDHGFEVRFARLFDRPTTLAGEPGLREWLDGFGDALLAPFDGAEREAVVAAIEERCRPELYDPAAEEWTSNYRRLRFEAVLPGGSASGR